MPHAWDRSAGASPAAARGAGNQAKHVVRELIELRGQRHAQDVALCQRMGWPMTHPPLRSLERRWAEYEANPEIGLTQEQFWRKIRANRE